MERDALISKLGLSGKQLTGLILVFIFILVSWVGYRGIYLSRQRTIKMIHDETDHLREKLTLLRTVEQEEKRADQLLAELGGYGELSDLIGLVNQTTQNLGIVVNGMNPGSLTSDDYLEAQSVQVDVQCSYHLLGSFVSQIESAGHYLRVERIDLTAINPLSSISRDTSLDELDEVTSQPVADILVSVVGVRAKK